MTTENRVLKTTTELLNHARGLQQAAQDLAELGRDNENEAIVLEEWTAQIQSWEEHLQEEVQEEEARRQRKQC
jgi:hypothetical protein